MCGKIICDELDESQMIENFILDIKENALIKLLFAKKETHKSPS